MIVDIVIKKSIDGYSVEIPSIKGCESWAHDENTALEKIIELASFYLKIPKDKFKIDKARKEEGKIIYKLIFHKN
ncbi:MAG: type II toxin-antitoxin system HicB family antitoxin [Ignavibacterium sp.]|uniref:type II toxin-antitoxin system HicB family antitoxin n=1 Tax=Ignavibacterium sp. TaxID=2651167 RepID=UPI004049C14E